MDGAAVKALVENLKEPKVATVSGRDFLTLPPGWTQTTREIAKGHSLKVGTLTGLVDYLTAPSPDAEATDRTKLIVHVESPDTVTVRLAVEGADTDYRRRALLQATTELTKTTPFPFGTFVDSERLHIGLLTQFVDTPEREKLIVFCAAIQDTTVLDVVDDKVSQRVNLAQGVSRLGAHPVPNPVTLQPWRTFVEVEQPASLFVLRMRRDPNAKPDQPGKPQAALFEADGSRWKLDAIQRIATFLRSKLGPDVKILA